MSIKLVQSSLNSLALTSYINTVRLLRLIVQHWCIINKFIVYTGVHCGVYSLGFGEGMMMFTSDYSIIQNNPTYSLLSFPTSEEHSPFYSPQTSAFPRILLGSYRLVLLIWQYA